MHSNIQLHRITMLISNAIMLAIIIIIPLGYFFTAFSYEKRMLEEQSLIEADILSTYIFTHPHSWQFQEDRLQDILSDASWRRVKVYYIVYDVNNKIIVEEGVQPAWPYHSKTVKLFDNKKTVGYIKAHTSLRIMYYKTMIAFVVALIVALIVFYTLRTLPFAAIQRVMKSLESSQNKLIEEIDSKNEVLKDNKKVNDELQYRAMYDSLTKIANREYFCNFVEERILQAKDKNNTLAIMILDLNRFKDVNDSLGHHVGDELLKRISATLQQAIPNDGFLARLGGDEFAIMLKNYNQSGAIQQAELITNALSAHIVIDDYHIVASASIGISCYPEHGESYEVLMKHADLAMYHAKQSSKPFGLYIDAYDDNSINRLTLTSLLRHALDNNLLSIAYQPKIELASGNMIGVEALCRWIDPQHGFISPEVFIPIAEQAGMINLLTEVVLEASLRQLASWHKSGIMISMAVNISARNLQNENFPTEIKQLLTKYNIEAKYLNIEVTESSMMINPEKSLELLNLISKRGVKVSIDDFGTGYSSLAYLKKLNASELKIDRSFVIGMFANKDDRIIVESTIELAHNLGMQVVAEGVEDQGASDLLKSYQCDYIQGYFICVPGTSDDIEQWHYANTVK